MDSLISFDLNVNYLELVCFVPPGGGSPIHKNRPYHGVAFYPDGKGIFHFSGTDLTVTRGDMIYLPKGSDYTVESVHPMGCYAINFDLAVDPHCPPGVFHTKNFSHYLDCFKQAEAVWRAHREGYDLLCRAKLYEILYQWKKEAALGYLPRQSRETLQPALDLIHETYTTEVISVPRLAQCCGISEIYFRRLFQRSMGCTPLKYINQLKLSRARELIASGLFSIGEVSRAAGFRDESYFSREFKKAEGVSPSEYRETALRKKNSTP